jgi:hypothetical protein
LAQVSLDSGEPETALRPASRLAPRQARITAAVAPGFRWFWAFRDVQEVMEFGRSERFGGSWGSARGPPAIPR